MFLVSRLRQRHRQPEIMDGPDLDTARHEQALRGLERINRASGSARLYWPALRRLAVHLARPVRVLDLACGAGDVLRALWKRAHRAGLALELTGCDLSPIALDHARRRAEAEGAVLTFIPLDVLHDPLPVGHDVVLCSLFLHHLDEADAVRLLRRMGELAGRMLLVNDLTRGPAGWLLAWLGTRLLSRSDVVRHDGLRSVEGAFTPDEALRLAGEAGLTGATVERRWPCRFLLAWRRPDEGGVA